MRSTLVLVVLCGCGRLGFDAAIATDGATLDGAADTAVPRFCATQTSAFCSDFDDANDVAQWEDSSQFNGAFMVVGRQLAASSTTVASGDSASAYLSHSVSATTTAVMRASVDVFIDNAASSDAVLLVARLDQTSTLHGIEYVYRAMPMTPYIEEAYDPVGPSPLQTMGYDLNVPALPTGEWHRITMTIDVASSPHALVEHDGVQIADIPLVLSAQAGSPSVFTGLVFVSGPTAPWQFHFDNVTADAQ